MPPSTQKAWCVTEFGKPLEKLEIPVPKPSGTELLIKVTHAGVCHSDLHFWDGYFPLGGGKKYPVTLRGATLPRAIGHEILGTVAEYGPDVSDADQKACPVGSSRAVYPWVGCQNCRRCADGDDNLCLKQRTRGTLEHGGFAQYITIPHAKYLVDHDGVNPSVACTYGCSGLTVLSAIQKLGKLKPQDPILLIGAGGLGLQAISVLKALGHEKIISADITEDKRQAALKAGATATVDSSAAEPANAVIEAAGEPVYGAIDFVNNKQTAELAMASLNKGGKMVAIGIMGGELQVDLGAMIFGSKTIIGNIVGTPANLRDVMKLAQSGNMEPLPVNEVPWDQVNDAMERLNKGQVTGRMILIHD